jgi:hypothetical protein
VSPQGQVSIKVLYPSTGSSEPLWGPQLGPVTTAALTRAFGSDDTAAAVAVREEAIATLANCLAPTQRSTSRTGLVVGYVQSGKTLAFTVLSALARDNGYPLVIILTGIVKNLLQQSTDRLREDLGASEGGWQFYTSEELASGPVIDQVAGCLDDWNDDAPWVRKETVVITVLKNGSHLDAVHLLLERLRLRGVLATIPVLLIDDEADQAGLNTLVRKQDQSPTYRRILRLRSALKQHSYVQYTATPQAILLMSLMDELSPSFVQLLTPGSAYTGGQAFFASERDLVRSIPDDEISEIEQLRDHPPDSLRRALASFVVACAVGAWRDADHRSMLVHPHFRTEYHAKSVKWLRGLVDRWRQEIDLYPGDPDRTQLEGQLREAYDDIAATSMAIPPWIDVAKAIPYVLRKITVHEMNTRSRKSSTSHIDWHLERFTVLVGGQKLDRGYTVRGLTTTYMPRSLGVGNADTVQQRARWFGYKEDYLGQCRVFLREEVAEAYRKYVGHEESIRRELASVIERGGSMADWRRRFFLDRDLKPTRSSVVGRNLLRGGGRDWFVTGNPAYVDPQLSENRVLVQRWTQGLALSPDDRFTGLGLAGHLTATGVDVKSVLSDLLLEWQMTDGLDSARRAVTMLQLQHALERELDLQATVYVMRPRMGGQGGSRRQVLANGRIENVFQGRSGNYPGDRELSPKEDVVVQLHSIKIMDGESLLGENVPVLAIHIPLAIARDWLAEVHER